ncbi:SDR family NAD(P)-dependent oxidoreductase [Aureimonas sp. Leaf324]|jgi:NAD(P)-dependent dehydrogenase (short-subunit alcohol dehydrogenase family)|uniref:SDR family NAD(P)-dependent oxidoreductase n=1 Tax=Aureimonas sp. Leaf324 TaxID=1736336 RepID=UPI000AA3DAC8|nr:SDR family NAD(P)-dependent oxidoreductase [Aureimonas sp. Leaf324]
MDPRIGGRVAIITGASDGMGWATARLLTQEGVRLVVSDVKTDVLEREVATLGGEAIGVKADVTSQARSMRSSQRRSSVSKRSTSGSTPAPRATRSR